MLWNFSLLAVFLILLYLWPWSVLATLTIMCFLTWADNPRRSARMSRARSVTFQHSARKPKTRRIYGNERSTTASLAGGRDGR
jgi:hypothetical protein